MVCALQAMREQLQQMDSELLEVQQEKGELQAQLDEAHTSYTAMQVSSLLGMMYVVIDVCSALCLPYHHMSFFISSM